MKFFNQEAPQLGNQFDDDRVLRSYLRRVLPEAVLDEATAVLREMGELAGGELYRMQLADREKEPTLIQWDAWGNRIDEIELTAVWQKVEPIAAKHGVVATAYEQQYGRFSRIVQFALAYLFHPSTDVYTCPLAMTDGAARTLLASGNEALIARAVPRLTSRDPDQFWTSGQWMTESTGGSDVGRSETVARQEADGTWRLYGRKWFTSAATSQMTLTLARPEGNPAGGKGLALFYVETRDENGRLQNITLNRLKDKLGTRKVPTAELIMDGTPAVPVLGLANGVRNIVPMLHLTRTWNAISAVSFMRRGLALAEDYAQKRSAFGKLLSEQPLHVDTLLTQQAEFEAAFQLTFFVVSLIGKDEAGEISAEEAGLLRLLTSIMKLTTGKQAVSLLSEVLECFGGAGYVEDTGLPLLLRDAQVLPIWEGTTNVLSLDALRALGKEPQLIQTLLAEAERRVAEVHDAALRAAGQVGLRALRGAAGWLEKAMANGRLALEAGARRFALTVGRAFALVLLVEQAHWLLLHEQDGRSRAAALRFAKLGVNQIFNGVDEAKLANDRLSWGGVSTQHSRSVSD